MRRPVNINECDFTGGINRNRLHKLHLSSGRRIVSDIRDIPFCL